MITHKHIDVNWVFGFHSYRYILWRQQVNGCFVSSPSDPSRDFSHMRKDKACSVGEDAWVYSKVLWHGISSSLWSILDMLNIFMHYLPDKKLWHSHVSCYGPNWFAGIIVNHGLDLTNKFRHSFFMRTIRVKFLSCCTFVISFGLISF